METVDLTKGERGHGNQITDMSPPNVNHTHALHNTKAVSHSWLMILAFFNLAPTTTVLWHVQ